MLLTISINARVNNCILLHVFSNTAAGRRVNGHDTSEKQNCDIHHVHVKVTIMPQPSFQYHLLIVSKPTIKIYQATPPFRDI